MMNGQQNLMRQLAQMSTQEQAKTTICTVTSYDPNAYSAKVMSPSGQETGWLPVTSAWSGNGWGIFCPPTSGDMVEVQFQDDGNEAGFICGRFFNDQDRPLAVPSGELWLVHESGAFFKLLNDGKATFSDANGASVTLNGDGTITSAAITWNHAGAFNVDGTITATEDVIAADISLVEHPHDGVTPGAGQSGVPIPT